MSVFQDVVDFFKKMWGGFVGQLFKQAAQTAAGALAEGLADIAAEVIKDLASGEFMTSDEKRNAAFSAIKNCAVSEGKQFTDHAINIAIELALAVLKEGVAQISAAAQGQTSAKQ